MKLPGRIELWLLLAVIVAGLIFVFASSHRDDEGAGGAGTTASSGDAPLRLHRCVLKRDYGSARLDIELRVRNAAPEKLVLQPPQARLLSAIGREIPGFYLPFEALPEVAARSTQDVLVRYWLEAADLQGALRLDVNGQGIEIKGAKAFDLDSMKNQEEKTFRAGEW